MTQWMYLFCIADTVDATSLWQTGIDSCEVVTVHYKNLSLVTHVVKTLAPFENRERTKEWVEAHHRVIEQAMKKYGTVLPFALGTVIRGGETELKAWLETEYFHLTKNMENVRGIAEYGVQIFWFPSHELHRLTATEESLKEFKAKSEGSDGIAYLYRQRFEKELKSVLERRAQEKFLYFFEKIKGCVSKVAIERIKDCDGEKQMLLHVSCLADSAQMEVLGEVLETIQNEEDPVCFTGPWPPYAFSN